MALMDFHTFVPETDEETYGTADDQRYDQWLNMIKTFDGPQAALAWQNKHSAEVTGQILADSNRLVAEVDSHMRLGGGLEEVAKLMDDINGDGGGADVVTLEDGRRALVETDANGATTRIIAAAENETELSALVQTMTKPEAAINVAERLYQTKKRALDTRVTEQNIKTANSLEGVNEANVLRIKELVKGMEGERELNAEQVKLVEQQTKKIVAELDPNRGLTKSAKQKQLFDQTAKFIGQYLLMEDPTGAGLDDALQAFKENLLGQGGDGWRVQPAATQ